MKKLLVVGVTLMVLGIAIGGAVWWRGRGQTDACAPNRANAQAAPDVAGQPGGRRVTVLGDSYATGFGLDDPTDAWPYLLADELGWNATVDGFGGSGFTTDSPCGGDDYLTRAAKIPADSELVVVEGGLNDVRVGSDADQVETGAGAVIDAVRRAAPTARIVLVGPSVVPYFDKADTLAVSDALKATAAQSDVEFVDALDWVSKTIDQVHPTAAVAKQYAAMLSRELPPVR